jgi:hypothetical protein
VLAALVAYLPRLGCEYHRSREGNRYANIEGTPFSAGVPESLRGYDVRTREPSARTPKGVIVSVDECEKSITVAG